MYDSKDIIAAIATGSGGAIGIIRISGPGSGQVLRQVFDQAEQALYSPRQLVYGALRDSSGLLLDRPLAVWTPGPHSYTGEDAAELHCHGGRQVLSLALAVVLEAGARLAEPGEFTLRAFLNGRLDLTQAEAVAELISSRTNRAAAQAAAQLDGALRRPLEEIYSQITEALALVTVAADFPDDADAPEGQELALELEQIAAAIERLLEGSRQGALLREGANAVIVGAVNAGKSSLLNALLRQDRAIVTPEPGATRDVIQETIDLDGMPLTLSDTAGLREDQGLSDAERQGMERTRRLAGQADIILLVLDAAAPQPPLAPEAAPLTLYVLNKADIASPAQLLEAHSMLPAGAPCYIISARTGQGLPALRQAISSALGADALAQGPLPLVAGLRQAALLEQAREYLLSAAQGCALGAPVDLAAVDLEAARRLVGQVSGHTADPDLLDTIFSRFCLGK